MRAHEVIISYYDLDTPASFQGSAELEFVWGQVDAVQTHKKGGYMWGTFSNAKDSVGFYSLLPCLLTTHIFQEKSYYCGHPALAQVIANAYFHAQNVEGAANFNAGWNPIPDSVIGLVGAAVCVVVLILLKLTCFLV